MKLEAGKEMDRCCVIGWLNEVYRHPKVAFNTYSDEQQIEFAHDALVLLKEQENCENCAIAIEDRQPIVRCKDCDNKECWGRAGDVVCGIDGTPHRPDWFCADGVAKDINVLNKEGR